MSMAAPETDAGPPPGNAALSTELMSMAAPETDDGSTLGNVLLQSGQADISNTSDIIQHQYQ